MGQLIHGLLALVGPGADDDNMALQAIVISVLVAAFVPLATAQYPGCYGQVCVNAPSSETCNNVVGCCFTGTMEADNCDVTCSEPQTSYCPDVTFVRGKHEPGVWTISWVY